MSAWPGCFGRSWGGGGWGEDADGMYCVYCAHLWQSQGCLPVVVGSVTVRCRWPLPLVETGGLARWLAQVGRAGAAAAAGCPACGGATAAPVGVAARLPLLARHPVVFHVRPGWAAWGHPPPSLCPRGPPLSWGGGWRAAGSAVSPCPLPPCSHWLGLPGGGLSGEPQPLRASGGAPFPVLPAGLGPVLASALFVHICSASTLVFFLLL